MAISQSSISALPPLRLLLCSLRLPYCPLPLTSFLFPLPRLESLHHKVTAEPTFRPLLLNQPLQRKVHHLAAQLPRKHEHHLCFARGEDERDVRDAETLRNEREPGAEVGDGVRGVLGKG